MVENYAHRDVWAEPPETTSIEVLSEVAKGLGEAFDGAHAGAAAAVRLRRALGGDHLPGQQHRSAAAWRATDRPAGAQRQDS